MILVSPVFDATANEDDLDLAVWQLFQRLAPPPAFKMWSGWPTFPIVFDQGRTYWWAERVTWTA
jgi:hypothetical protein